MFQGRWQSVEFVFTCVLKKGWALRLFAFCTWNITTPGWLSPSCEVSLECKIQSTSSSCCQDVIIVIPSADVRSSSIYTNTHCSMYRTAYASAVCTVLSMPIIIQYTQVLSLQFHSWVCLCFWPAMLNLSTGYTQCVSLICTPAKAVFLVGSYYLISVMHIILKRRLCWVIIMWSRFFLFLFLYACFSPVFPSGFWFCSIKAVKPLACQKHAEGTCCSELCKWQVKCNSRSLPEWMMDVLSTKNGFQTLFIFASILILLKIYKYKIDLEKKANFNRVHWQLFPHILN